MIVSRNDQNFSLETTIMHLKRKSMIMMRFTPRKVDILKGQFTPWKKKNSGLLKCYQLKISKELCEPVQPT